MSKVCTVSIQDKHSVCFYDEDGTYTGMLYITSGEIIGQPVVSGEKFTVTYSESGVTYINVYNLDSHSLIRRNVIN